MRAVGACVAICAGSAFWDGLPTFFLLGISSLDFKRLFSCLSLLYCSSRSSVYDFIAASCSVVSCICSSLCSTNFSLSFNYLSLCLTFLSASFIVAASSFSTFFCESVVLPLLLPGPTLSLTSLLPFMSSMILN